MQRVLGFIRWKKLSAWRHEVCLQNAVPSFSIFSICKHFMCILLSNPFPPTPLPSVLLLWVAGKGPKIFLLVPHLICCPDGRHESMAVDRHGGCKIGGIRDRWVEIEGWRKVRQRQIQNDRYYKKIDTIIKSIWAGWGSAHSTLVWK